MAIERAFTFYYFVGEEGETHEITLMAKNGRVADDCFRGLVKQAFDFEPTLKLHNKYYRKNSQTGMVSVGPFIH